MLTTSQLAALREEIEQETRWRDFSRHYIAYSLECCEVCGLVKSFEGFLTCKVCRANRGQDVYLCGTGCARKHLDQEHPHYY
jgi:hypothetical protein